MITATDCPTETVTIKSPVFTAPILTTSAGVCNGTTYDVTFSSNGVVSFATSDNSGVLTGNTITGITVGVAVVITSGLTNGCATTVATVSSPTDCPENPTVCTTPSLNVGNAVCDATSGTYSVSFNSSATGADLVISSGTLSASGTMITGITQNVNLTITASDGTCTTSITVTAPEVCPPVVPCSEPAVSFSVSDCDGSGMYSINITNPNGAILAVSAGNLTATAITGIASGTDVVIMITATDCPTETVTIKSPVFTAPILTTSAGVCNGTTYDVTFSSNGVVSFATSDNSGVLTGNTITGITVGVAVVITSGLTNGCATTVATVSSPTDCPENPTVCTTPSLNVGNAVCDATSGTYSVSFNSSATGADLVISSGTLSASGTMITGITQNVNLTITASDGTCTTSITVTAPEVCPPVVPCSEPAVSFSVSDCDGSGMYSINITNPNGAILAVSAGNLTATAITG